MNEFRSSIKKNPSIETIEEMSESRREPDWLREFRLRSYDILFNRSVPNSVCDPLKVDLQNIYYPAASEKDKRLDNGGFSIDTPQLPVIPQREPKSFIETDIQYDSDSICHNLRRSLRKLGVIFVGIETAVKDYPELLEKHFGMVIPPEDNRVAALNGALWSSGSFIYVPPNVRIDFPIYSNYRSNIENTTDQFERNLIIADEGAEVHYIEGCTSPTHTLVEGSLHSLATELIAKKYAKIRYTAIRYWRKDVNSLVSRRAHVYEDATIEWIDGNIGSKLTMGYPSVYLLGRNAFAKIVSLAFAGSGEHQDVGVQIVHLAPSTTSKIISKSISNSHGRTTFKGLLHIGKGAIGAKTDIQLDALVLNETSDVSIYPCLEVNEKNSNSSYDAIIRKVGTDQMFYLMSRGYSKSDAISMIVSGFTEPFSKQLPVEYAVELSRLIKLEIEEGICSHRS